MELLKLKVEENEIVLRVNNLTVSTREEKSWWRRKATRSKTTILNNVSACMKTGDFVAVIGPSGAGKTTFLTSLAGKCNLVSSGSVAVNNTETVNIRSGLVELVPQSDVFMEHLTVSEHMIFMTEMKLGSVKKEENRNHLASLIHELKLKALENNTIRSLSGGEKRLLSLATSLILSPIILICDEPTTGLDSYSASLVIAVLKKLSQGKIVICSVHQPSSDLFNEFNSVCLMSEGNLVFCGSQGECKKQFERLKLHCPVNFNPAEFYIRAISNGSVEFLENNQQPCIRTGSSLTLPQIKTCQRNWFKQIQLLVWRSSLSIKRDLKDYLIQLFVSTLISSIIIGTCYVGISGRTQRGVQDLKGFLWLMCSEVSFSLSYVALYAFESDLTLFKREVGVYRTSAFYVCRFLCLLPKCLVWPIAYVLIVTLAIELPNYILTAFKLSIALIITAVASSAYGLGMGALFTSTGVMGDVMPCADLPLFIMSGAFIRLSSLPIWLLPLKYISHFYYGMDAVSNIYWRQIDVIDCPTNSTSICYKDGIAVLTESGYSNNISDNYLGFAFVTVLWNLLGYYGLKREENKGYIY
ncbi:protein brown [Pieris rapae]|uniref:protein brown n=1 Tax=Pieris rapae TaxID=64459 RepID=UPI001E27FAFD|nr:protein brown [Pieris rapae]